MTQLETIKQQLRETGEVSRNWCIRERYITRLGARIVDLKNKGWEFRMEKREGDYVYVLLKDPANFDENVWSKDEIERRRVEAIPRLNI